MSSCLINQRDCGREPGNPVCPKCGIDERVVYPGHADLEAALEAARQRYAAATQPVPDPESPNPEPPTLPVPPSAQQENHQSPSAKLGSKAVVLGVGVAMAAILGGGWWWKDQQDQRVRWAKGQAAQQAQAAEQASREREAEKRRASEADRLSSDAKADDAHIENDSIARLRAIYGDQLDIRITSYNRMVLLTGTIPSGSVGKDAEKIVGAGTAVRSMINELHVGPSSSLSSKAEDALITGKVKSELIATPDVKAGAVRIVTEQGVVYLMGLLSQREVERAAGVVRRVVGVRKVVSMVDLIRDDTEQ